MKLYVRFTITFVFSVHFFRQEFIATLVWCTYLKIIIYITRRNIIIETAQARNYLWMSAMLVGAVQMPITSNMLITRYFLCYVSLRACSTASGIGWITWLVLYSLCPCYNLRNSVETVVQRCSVKKVFLEISQISQGNTCARVPFLIKLQVSTKVTHT